MALTITQHHSFDEPGIRQQWRQLDAEGHLPSVFSTCAWNETWYRTIGRHTQLALLQARNEQNKTAGIVPTCVHKIGPARWLKFLGREGASGDHLDVICAAEQHADLLAGVLEYCHDSGDIHGLILGELHEDSPTLSITAAWARQHGYAMLQRERRIVPYTVLPATFEEYLTDRSSNMRYHIRRRRRELCKTEDAQIELHRDASAVQDVLQGLFDLHARRWQRAGQRGVFADQQKRDFLHQFCQQACPHDWVRCYALRRRSTLEAVLLAFHWRDTAYFYQMGWAPETSVRSPGVLLLAESIEQAIRENLCRYDFLRGDEAYKAKWASQQVCQTTLVVACRAPARSMLLAERLKNRFKALLQDSFGDNAWDKVKRLTRR